MTAGNQARPLDVRPARNYLDTYMQKGLHKSAEGAMATILMVDDEADLRKVVVRRLEMEGHNLITYADAAPALAKANFDIIDLIIMDLMMPTPGEEAIATLRERGIKKPIIVLSGNLKRGDSERLIATGANSVLSKPFRLMGLLATIEQYLPKS
jgi:CheY-like chemotaxis protein